MLGQGHGLSRPIAVPLQVTYNVNSFIDKNNDLLFRDLSQAMWKARHPLLRSLFPEGDPKQASRKRPPTAGAQFKSSVAILMKNLYSKSPNYIRWHTGHTGKHATCVRACAWSMYCRTGPWLGGVSGIRVSEVISSWETAK